MIDKLRFEIKAKNNRLHELIFSRHKTLREFCELEGVQYNTVCAYVNLSQSPYGLGIHRQGQMSHHALRLCEILSQDPIELFPPELYGKGQKHKWVIKKNINMLTMEEASRPMIEHCPEVEVASPINYVLDTLSEKEKTVIKLRFGFDGGVPKSLEETGRVVRVTRERVRQIEAKAIRKLRHPSRSKFICDHSLVGLPNIPS